MPPILHMKQEEQSSQSNLYLIDGSSFIFRAFHAIPTLTRLDGVVVNAVYGYVKMLLKLIKDHKPDYFLVVFDTARKSFRNEIYADYKAHRPEPPEELIPQFGLVREATKAFCMASIEKEGYEADDIIATLAKKAAAEGHQVTIVSSDKDLMQLISDDISMYDAMKDRFIKREQVIEKFGAGPEKILDILSLAGDASDNVPGVAGIGPKTAVTLLEEYGTLENLLENAEQIKQPKRRQTLIDNHDNAILSKKLITLCDTVPVETNLEEYRLKAPDYSLARKFCEEQNFKSLVLQLKSVLESTYNAELIDEPEAIEPVAANKNYELVQTEEALNKWREAILEKGYVAFDTETNNLDPMLADLVGFSLAVEDGQACYVPLAHKKGEELDLENHQKDFTQISFETAIEFLKDILQSPSILKIAHNFKYDALVLAKYGIEVEALDDTMLISFLNASGRMSHGLDALALEEFGHQMISYKEVAGVGKSQVTFDYVDLDKACEYAAEDADYTLRLFHKLKPQLIKNQAAKVYEMIERPLIKVLLTMEKHGVKIDQRKLVELEQDFKKKSLQHEQEIYQLAGEEFNIGSPKQLGAILFEKLGFPGGKKGKSGSYGTNVKVLEELADQGHEIAEKILAWRQMTKLISTYIVGLTEQINPNTNRVHTSYLMTGAITGRLASTEPNLQNIPIRSKEGRQIREAFIAEEGFELLSIDYSQIELRLLAEMADITALQKAFQDGLDIHAMTASEMFHTPIEGMDPMVRRQAKAINFGIIYGISAFGLSQQLGISRTEAKDYIEQYFEKFPGIRKFMQKMKQFAVEYGYVETILGRRVYLNDIQSKIPAKRAFAERQAINAPLQGSAADIIKRAMIKIDKFLRDHHYKTRMLLQVHDELVFEVAKDEKEDIIPKLKELMETAAEPLIKVSVPLTVEANTGKNWDEAH